MKVLKIAAFIFLALPSLSQAALMKPESTEGKRVVHRLANEISDVFVGQTESLNDEEKVRASCESSKSSILADLDSLEVKGSRDLLDAKAALEKVQCPAGDAPGSDFRQVHSAFFAATVSLRSFDSLN